MNPLSYRPKTWNAVVGQERAVRLLQAILTYNKLIPRGFILEGPYGVGKTTTAYLLARGLMCLNHGTIGCGNCASCKLIDSQGLESPAVADFTQVDAASHSGVDSTREIASPQGWGEAPPALARRRVTLIDEAQRLSKAAWDVYLKPLELAKDYAVYIFATTRGEDVPDTIQSRCVRVPFAKVSEANLMGVLTAAVARERVPYEQNALKLIAHRSDGAPRNAINYLAQVSALGAITVPNVELVIDTTLENKCAALWMYAMEKNQVAAAQVVEELVQHHSPSTVLEKMCQMYADAVRVPATPLDSTIRSWYQSIALMTALFLKWLAVPHLPPDALQLFAYELMYLREGVVAPVQKPEPKPEKKGVSVDELLAQGMK